MIGIQLDNLRPALHDASLVTAVPAAAMLAAGLMMGSVRPDWRITVARLPWLVVWGFLQQFVLQGFVHRRMMEIVARDVPREILTAAVFAACHVPNWRLMIATFIGGWIWAALYRKRPNLLALALSHAVSSAALSIAFGPALLHGMKVGRGYFAYLPPPTPGP